jgi:hypothetical protein
VVTVRTEDDMKTNHPRSLWFATATLAIGGVFSAAPSLAADRAETVTIAVEVRDEANIPVDVLVNAKAELLRIYALANVRLHFTEAGPMPANTRTTVHLTIVASVPAGFVENAAGVAHRNPRRSEAEIFERRVEEISKAWGLKSAIVLACVMAHEIGHLLLPVGHSVSGIMRAHWGEDDSRQIGRGILRFNTDEVTLMHARLTTRASAIE